ncbi:hypothetical protein ACEPPN_000286 [Leptodophora sp. 'Broadleaf-Isolate-01']
MAPFLQESVSVDTFEPPSLDSLKIENANIKSCKIVGPLAWEGEQFKHESDYTYQLSEEEIHEIDEALSNFNGLSLHGRYISLMKSLHPTWEPFDPSVQFSNEFKGTSTPWLALDAKEMEAATSYMLGKQLWSLFEGSMDFPEPASVAGFGLPARCPTFPIFDKTPKELRSVIRDCNAGADEWEGIRQPFVIRGSRTYARDIETNELSDSMTMLQESASVVGV